MNGFPDATRHQYNYLKRGVRNLSGLKYQTYLLFMQKVFQIYHFLLNNNKLTMLATHFGRVSRYNRQDTAYLTPISPHPPITRPRAPVRDEQLSLPIDNLHGSDTISMSPN